MRDIALCWQIDGADFAVNEIDLLRDDSLSTAVIISLFTDRRALDSDELPQGVNTDPRGWWGDCFHVKPIGSRLWLLSREKQLKQVLVKAKHYAEEALAWLIEDGEVLAVQVTASNPQTGLLQLDIALKLIDGSELPMRFNALLNAL